MTEHGKIQRIRWPVGWLKYTDTLPLNKLDHYGTLSIPIHFVITLCHCRSNVVLAICSHHAFYLPNAGVNLQHGLSKVNRLNVFSARIWAICLIQCHQWYVTICERTRRLRHSYLHTNGGRILLMLHTLSGNYTSVQQSDSGIKLSRTNKIVLKLDKAYTSS